MTPPPYHHDHDHDRDRDRDHDGRDHELEDERDAQWDARLARIEPGLAGLTALVRMAGSDDAWRTAPDGVGLDRLSRRSLFKLAGAGIAAAGLAACSSRPSREILPYANQPPEVTPGVPLHFATALIEDGFAIGVVVASHEGRPTKIEGNPDHPASLGATRAIEQAAVLSLYDPQRARGITDRGAPAAWSAIEELVAAAAQRGGRGLYLVLEPTSSPYLIELIERVRGALPEAAFAFWSPFAPRASLAGNRIAFGRPLQTQLDFRGTEVIVSLDADLVAGHPMALAWARQISQRRQVVDGSSAMARLYVIETGYSPTGVIADHRLRARPSEIAQIATELLAAVLAESPASAVPPVLATALSRHPAAAERARAITAIARDLRRAAGRSVVAAGEHQPPAVHAIAVAINRVLGNIGRTVDYSEPVVFEAGQHSHDLAPLAHAIDRGEVRSLVVLGGNPVYTAPADLALAAAFRRVPSSVYVGLYDNETARACRFLVAQLHDLESWDAARSYDGTLTPQQPLIEPMFDGRTPAELLHALLGDPPALARDRVRAAWTRQLPRTELDDALALGVAAGSAPPPVTVEPVWPALAAAIPEPPPAHARLELALRPHPFVHDGRYTNNPWLLELPEPITKLTWENAAQLSPATAAALGLSHSELVALAIPGRAGAVHVPAVIVPGHADGAITLHAGFGRAGAERVAAGAGGNAFVLSTTDLGFHPAITATPLGARRELPITQVEGRDGDRPLALAGTLAQLRDDAEFRAELARHRGGRPSLQPGGPRGGPQWAMSIDLTTCTGCTACVMACAAENNTPVVGSSQVRNKREMHWLRIDRYYVGPTGAATAIVQPMTCQHCEKAPCEYVCPVYATTHSPDGLNEMTYNRCIGTRFCSNNCPYKVRRFNWFDLKDRSLHLLARNPDVTVRDRGVMEKCTYCVQRIRRAEIDARIGNRSIGRDEVRTACAQVCPVDAIRFGSLGDPGAAVTEHRGRPHSYAVLDQLNTEPRTRYLARIRNPNGAMP